MGGAGVERWKSGEEDGIVKKKEKKRKRLSGGMVGTFPVGGDTEETVSGAGTGIANTNLLVIPPTPALLPGLPGPTHYCQPTWPSYMFENDFREKVRFLMLIYMNYYLSTRNSHVLFYDDIVFIHLSLTLIFVMIFIPNSENIYNYVLYYFIYLLLCYALGSNKLLLLLVSFLLYIITTSIYL